MVCRSSTARKGAGTGPVRVREAKRVAEAMRMVESCIVAVVSRGGRGVIGVVKMLVRWVCENVSEMGFRERIGRRGRWMAGFSAL